MVKPKWRVTALALATAALLGTASVDANALGLGRVTVQSALGEPLRAQVDIVEITPDELASLKVSVAPPDAFRAAGFEYSSVLSATQVTLQQRPDGQPYLLLTSPRPVNDPFIDLILETQWASGRIVRDYTMLFDPPQMRAGSAATAQVTPLPPRAAAPAPLATPRTTRAPAVPSPAARTTAPERAPATGETPTARGEQVTVHRGDSAGKIAAQHKPASVSLDQMLVALLQANPAAFTGANVNRLKAGAVLQIPSAEQAAQQPKSEAMRMIIAQSRDFNEYRRRLAERVPATPLAGSQRQASGKVQAQVEEKVPGPSGPDKLKLSKGSVQGKTAADRIALEREARDAAARVAELNKNIADLNKLQGSTVQAAPAAAANAPAGPALAAGSSTGAAAKALAPIAAPVVAATVAAPAVQAVASAPKATASTAKASTAATSAPAPAAVAAKATPAARPAAAIAKKPAPAVPVEEPSLLDDLLENPLVLAAVGGVVALLAGFGVYRLRQRKKSPQVDSSFLESRLQPDSFFGGSGGQRIDTAEGGATGSSMVYSPSQLDAAGDVDPVAEADVYLAYGRDLQAEEILKEALRVSPHRVAIHSKLLEIYAKRRDTKAFEVTATDAYGLTHGEGLEWERICELGRELDASNPLYRPGGAPSAAAAAAGAVSAASARVSALDAPATMSPDLDLDLDFSSGDDAAPPSAGRAVHLHAAPEAEPDHVELDLPDVEHAQASAQDVDLPTAPEVPVDLPIAPVVEPVAAALALPAAAALDEPLSIELPIIEEPKAAQSPAVEPPRSAAAPDLEMDGLAFDFEPEPSPAPVAAAVDTAAAPAAADDKMIEFDLGSLSLDLDSSAPAATPKPPAPQPMIAAAPAGDAHSTQGAEQSTEGLEEPTEGDPLATKFALAQEFNAIGDPDGARSLAEEVLAEASGDLRSRAQKFLAEIG
ncbi:MAG TPA: FimV/HubP family polar landmark protein [Ramlibacter sp.]|nr:FimV/HubP family polar landmark protein [Ramlibacter sp.]